MNKKPAAPSIPDTEEAWSSGELGKEEEFAAIASDDNSIDAAINEHLELQPISIRLEKSLIEDFKIIAKMHGLGYQPLMRQTLKRFADCEKKRILREVAVEMAKANNKKSVAQSPIDQELTEKQKKAA
jgi:predicted DNA binding CopG/RHH family protein